VVVALHLLDHQHDALVGVVVEIRLVPRSLGGLLLEMDLVLLVTHVEGNVVVVHSVQWFNLLLFALGSL